MLRLIASMLSDHSIEPLNLIRVKDTVINPNFLYQAIEGRKSSCISNVQMISSIILPAPTTIKCGSIGHLRSIEIHFYICRHSGSIPCNNDVLPDVLLNEIIITRSLCRSICKISEKLQSGIGFKIDHPT